MKQAKKAIALILCAVMLVAASVMGTMAYLTSQTVTVKNTFTVGNVAITLDEARVDAYGVREDDADRVTTNTYKLIPGHTYTKDPTVHVAEGSENCWLFVKVTNGISDIEAAGETTIATQMGTNGWTLVNGETNVYAYNETVSEKTDVKVFETFTIDGEVEVANYTSAEITVTAYAIQADGFGTAAAAWEAAPANWTAGN